MDWSNENVLEFIELLHEEPCIWNHKSKDHKNRKLLNEAWVRISKNFSVPCSVEELKKKRNTLLTQYRDCLRRIKEKESTQTGFESYKPAWFAFDAIDSYMGDLYDYRQKISGETVELLLVEDSDQSESDHGDGPLFPEITEEQPLESPLSFEPSTDSVSRESANRKRKESNADPLGDSFQTMSREIKRHRRIRCSPIPKKQIVEDFSFNKIEETTRECDLYGQLLAQKLKPLNIDDRLVIMNDIDNLMFKFMINIRKRCKLSRSAHLAAMKQTQSDNRQSNDVLGPSTRSNQSEDSGQKNVPFRMMKMETEAEQ